MECDGPELCKLKTRLQRRMISVDNFFHIFEIIIFCFVVAMCDLVHVTTIFHLSYVLCVTLYM